MAHTHKLYQCWFYQSSSGTRESRRDTTDTARPEQTQKPTREMDEATHTAKVYYRPEAEPGSVVGVAEPGSVVGVAPPASSTIPLLSLAQNVANR